MSVVIIGGTGLLGREVVNAVCAHGSEAHIVTRSAEKAGQLPGHAEAVVADLDQPASLSGVFKSSDSLFLLIAIGPRETAQGLAAVEAAKRQGMRKIVYLSVAGIEEGSLIPHFASKIPVEKAVKESGIPFTILRPNNFFQNDLRLRDVLVRYGIYPQPIGMVGISRIDTRDIAAAAARALLEPGFENQVWELHGPEELTGESVAKTYGRYLHKEVLYGGDDLEMWERQARNTLPAWLVSDLKAMFAHFQKHGLKAGPGQLAKQEQILGRKPRFFDVYVAEQIMSWKA